MRYDSVQRWMHATKCKDSSKSNYLRCFDRFLRVVKLDNPDQLVDEYIQEMKSDDPRVRLRAADRMNKFHDEYSRHSPYQAWLILVSTRSFYHANACSVMVKAPFPKTPKREQNENTIARLGKLTPAIARYALPVLRSLILTLAESGIRIGSAVQLRYADIKEDFEANALPMVIRLSGRITKTGLPYRAFVLDDARDAIREQLEIRKRQGETIDDDTLIFPMRRGWAMQQIRKIGDLVGMNRKTSGLREFSTKLWRKRVQTLLERDEYHINPNHVSLLPQAMPRGRDAHYSSPPKEELAKEYMKAANELRVSGPLFIKPTTDELLKQIQELPPEEQLCLISELETLKNELGSKANVEQITDLLAKFGVVQQPIVISGT